MSDEEARSRWEVRDDESAFLQSILIDRRRFQDLHNHVTAQTAQAFVTSFLTRCVRANTEHTSSLDDTASSLASLPHLSPSILVPKYKYSQNRIVLVDFEGTLWRRDLSQGGVLGMLGGAPDAIQGTGEVTTDNVVKLSLPEEVEEAIGVLGKLAEDRKNEVWLLSGLRVRGVLEAVAERVPQVGIV
jgi:trehalose 6-phosphate synthase/phosphatase